MDEGKWAPKFRLVKIFEYININRIVIRTHNLNEESTRFDITNYSFTFDEFAHGSERRIVDHFFDKLNTMKANTVLAGSRGFSEDPIILPPLY